LENHPMARRSSQLCLLLLGGQAGCMTPRQAVFVSTGVDDEELRRVSSPARVVGWPLLRLPKWADRLKLQAALAPTRRAQGLAYRDSSTHPDRHRARHSHFSDPVKLFDEAYAAVASGELLNLKGGNLLNGTFPGSIPQLVAVLFTDRSPFPSAFNERVGRSNVTVGEWACDGTKCVRTVSYIGEKTALVPEHAATEKQQLRLLPGGECVVSVRTLTPRVPFGDKFVTVLQYQLASSLPDQAPFDSTGVEQTQVAVSWDLEWRGRPPAVAGMIRSGAGKGLKANFDAFARVLTAHTVHDWHSGSSSHASNT